MPILKPIRGSHLNRSHPLAHGLVGCWLFNEATGKKLFDLSGNDNSGTFIDNPQWKLRPGMFVKADIIRRVDSRRVD